MWRAILLGYVLTVPMAIAGERSPGDDLRHDGGPRDRYEWRQQQRQRLNPWGQPRLVPRWPYEDRRYVAPGVPNYRRSYDPWLPFKQCVGKYGSTPFCSRFLPDDSNW